LTITGCFIAFASYHLEKRKNAEKNDDDNKEGGVWYPRELEKLTRGE